MSVTANNIANLVQIRPIRADNGSAGHGSWVKWVNKSEWVTCVTGRYRKTLDLCLIG